MYRYIYTHIYVQKYACMYVHVCVGMRKKFVTEPKKSSWQNLKKSSWQNLLADGLRKNILCVYVYVCVCVCVCMYIVPDIYTYTHIQTEPVRDWIFLRRASSSLSVFHSPPLPLPLPLSLSLSLSLSSARRAASARSACRDLYIHTHVIIHACHIIIHTCHHTRMLHHHTHMSHDHTHMSHHHTPATAARVQQARERQGRPRAPPPSSR